MKLWKNALICGGGSGLGLGIAQRLLRRGTEVSILDLKLSDESRKVLDACGKGNWRFFEADVTDSERMNQVVNEAVQQSGSPDLALNTAGIILNKTFENMTAESFRKVIDVNLHGSYNFAQAVIRHLEPGSRLALIASIAGLTSNYGYTAYGVSKFGVVGLAHTLRYEYVPRGIGITCVCPPEVKTPMVEFERTPGNADPISLALKDVAGSLDPDYACDEILKGIDAGKWMVVPGYEGKMTVFMARHFPNGFFNFMKFHIRKNMRKHGVALVN